MMLIGYASTKLQKICTKSKDARKALSQDSADALPDRLQDLAAFDNLGLIPIKHPPLHFHPLREDRAGEFAINLKGLDRVVFKPVGDFQTTEDGGILLSSVTSVEVTFVGNYHNYG